MHRVPSFDVRLKPRVVQWLVNSSGMDRDTIARKMRVDRPHVDGWIDTGVIEYSKMRRLAECIKRSEPLFLLDSPPKEKVLDDYRMSKRAPKNLSPEDIVVVRRTRYAQSAAREMMEGEGEGASTEPQITSGITTSDRAEGVAQVERGRLLGGTQPGGALEGAADETYGKLREGIEAANVLVLQYPMGTDSVRGVSVTDSLPYAILVNSRETVKAKTFTLLHEYGHLLLRRGGICDEHGVAHSDSDKRRVEAWCNLFAASFLMPEAAFTDMCVALETTLRNPSDVIDKLARKFKTSKYASAVRAASLPGTGLKVEYMGLLDQIAGKNIHREKHSARRKGGSNIVEICISQRGRKFVKLALTSHDKGDITTLDLLDYLDIDLKHLDALQAMMETYE